MTEPPYSIGQHRLPGLAKVIEECGELLQVAGKVMSTGSLGAHPDGTHLAIRLEHELGDVLAAIDFFIKHNLVGDGVIEQRRKSKFVRFVDWHCEHTKKTGKPPASEGAKYIGKTIEEIEEEDRNAGD